MVRLGFQTAYLDESAVIDHYAERYVFTMHDKGIDASVSDCVADVTDNGDGSYTVAYRVTRTGQYTIRLGILGDDRHGPHLDASVTADFDAFVSAGPACPMQCTANGPGLKQSNAGRRAAFTVKMCDSLGNAISNGGAGTW